MIIRDILDKASVVDVRTPVEFSQRHFPGAVNIPLARVPDRISEFKEMTSPIVVYCRSGNRSGMVASILQQQGMKEVYNGGSLDELLQQVN